MVNDHRKIGRERKGEDVGVLNVRSPNETQQHDYYLTLVFCDMCLLSSPRRSELLSIMVVARLYNQNPLL